MKRLEMNIHSCASCPFNWRGFCTRIEKEVNEYIDIVEECPLCDVE